MEIAIETALKELGYKDMSKFTANPIDDYQYKIFFENEYFGIFDTQRSTFVD